MNRKKIIIHIGSPKTGTTTIQEILQEKTLELSSFNIIYPMIENPTGYGIDRKANGAILQPEYFDSKALENKINQLLERNDTIIFSEEVLFLGENSSFLKYLDNDNTTIVIVCFLRNAADYLASIWAELNRPENSFKPQPLHQFIHTDFYLKSLNALAELARECKRFVFNIHPYSEEKNFDVTEHFFNYLNSPKFIMDENPIKKNISLSRKEADIYQLVLDWKMEVPSCFDSTTLKKIAREIDSGDPRKVIETITDDQIDVVCKKHEDILNFLVKNIGKNNFNFAHIRPNCFGEKRGAYQPICTSDMPRIWSYVKSLKKLEKA